jgi:hypothetical protein
MNCIVQESGRLRLRTVQSGDHIAGGSVCGPIDSERGGGSSKQFELIGRCRWQSAQQPDPTVEHDLCRAHSGQQADFRIGLLDLVLRAEVQRPMPVGRASHLRVGKIQGDGMAGASGPPAQVSDLRQQRDRGMQGLVPQIGLNAFIIEPGNGAHQRPHQVYRGRLPVGIEVDRPQHRRPALVRQQAGRSLRQLPGMQRGRQIRAVERLPATPGLRHQRTLQRHEGSDVRDRVVHPVAVVPALQVHRLVEIHRSDRVDGHQGQVGAVQRRNRRMLGRRSSLSDGVRRIFGRHTEVHPNCGEIESGGAVEFQRIDAAGRHRPRVRARRSGSSLGHRQDAIRRLSSYR